MSVLAEGPIFDSPSEKPGRYWTYEGGHRHPRLYPDCRIRLRPEDGGEVKVMLPAEPPRRARVVGLCAPDALRNLLPDCIIEDFGRRGVRVVPC
jgi:hypothetical protein